MCASQGYDEILNFILEKNTTGLKIKNLYGKTPLDLAMKESTREIINKYLNIKKNKNGSPLNNKNNNQFSRIKIRKTNKNLMKCLMTPISPNELNSNNNNDNNLNINHISNTEPNNSLPKTTSKKFNTNKFNNNNTSITNSNREIKTSSTLTNSVTRPFNTNPNVIKKKKDASSKKIFTVINKDSKQNKQNKLKIEISSSNKISSNTNRKK